jgi:eukaryotic-like serine/threonine-protein kinase
LENGKSLALSGDEQTVKSVTPERWHQIKELLDRALDLDPAEREAFLAEACGSDLLLRKQVAGLVQSHDEAGSFIESPAFEFSTRLIAEAEPARARLRALGHYRIAERIGVGGMGEVFLAEDSRLGRKVALKLLLAESTADPDSVRRFEREARAASALNHPNIITIHEIGVEGGSHYIVTEFVEGHTLRQLMKGERLSLKETLDITVQVAAALAAAHETGIIHRDIKPENVMVRSDGIVKVLDFGLAKLTERRQADADAGAEMIANVSTHPGMVMGTVNYMSPEQARGLKVDVRTDIFSLGVMLYEMLAGHRPFRGETVSDCLVALLKTEPPPLSEYAPAAPAELQRIVKKALQKERQERYQNIKDLLVDLRGLSREIEIAGEVRRLHAPSTNDQAASAVSVVEPATRAAIYGGSATEGQLSPATVGGGDLFGEIRRHKAGLALAFAALVLVTLGLGYGVYRLAGREPAAPSAAAPLQKMKVTRLTTSGKVSPVAISPDGRYVAYGVEEANGQQSLWLRQTATSSTVQIVPPFSGEYEEVFFSRDGIYIYFSRYERETDLSALYQMPTLGGVAKKLTVEMGTVTISPDGQRLAFVRWNRTDNGSILFIANADGTHERELLARKRADLHISPLGLSWSPDGKTIVCNGTKRDETGAYTELYEVGVESGVVKPITSLRWRRIEDIAWLPDGSGFMINARDRDSGAEGPVQIWRVSYPNGEAQRITNDLNNYTGVSLTADGSTLVAVQENFTTSIWVSPSSEPSRATQITQVAADRRDGHMGLAWTPDGKIVYSSNAAGHLDLWVMRGDGSEPRQLTDDEYADAYPEVSPDGRLIIFSSNRSGSTGLWRMEAGGAGLAQVVERIQTYVQPRISPDGKWVVYTGDDAGKHFLYKVPVEGGAPVRLNDQSTIDLAISPDGSRIAYGFQTEANLLQKIAIIPFAGGEPTSIIDLMRQGFSRLQWMPDGRALSYVYYGSNVENIWKVALDGGKPVALTAFKSNPIFNYAWSRDGKYLACARGSLGGDVVLISNFK